MKENHLSISRRQLMAGTAAAATLALAGPAARAQEGALSFGLALPLSGSQALYGQDQVKAAEWGVAEINATGGVNGRMLEMIILDTQADPQLGIQAAQRLISVDKVPAMVTGFSAVVKAIAPVADDGKTVQLSVGANSPAVAHLGDYTYTTFPLSTVDITAVANYAATEMGKSRAAIVFINNETGVVAAELYRDVFTGAGGEVVAYEAYDPKATDWTGPLLKVRAAEPDVIHLQGLVADSPQVIAQMRQLGLNQPITSYSGVYNPQLIVQLGAAAEGVIATSLAPGVDDDPKVMAYVERWKSEVGREPNGLPYTQYLHDAPFVVAAVFKSLLDKGLPLTGDNFRTELVAIGTFEQPLTGKLTINDDHTVDKPVYLMEVKGGKWTKLAVID